MDLKYFIFNYKKVLKMYYSFYLPKRPWFASNLEAPFTKNLGSFVIS